MLPALPSGIAAPACVTHQWERDGFRGARGWMQVPNTMQVFFQPPPSRLALATPMKPVVGTVLSSIGKRHQRLVWIFPDWGSLTTIITRYGIRSISHRGRLSLRS